MTARRNSIVPRILFYVLVVVILIYTMFPFYWAIKSSFTPQPALFKTPVEYFPSQLTLENYRQVLTNRDFLQALVNSTIVAGSVVLLALLVGSFASYALGRLHFRGRTPMLYVILSMTMFPQIAVLGALFTMVNQLELYNRLTALIVTYLVFTLPFTVWVLTNFFKGMPNELEQAAYVDGTTPFQTFYMVLPVNRARFGHHRFVGVYRRVERIFVRLVVHANAGQAHRAGSNLPVPSAHRINLRDSMGPDHGSHRDCHHPIDRVGVDLPTPHHGWPDGGRGEGIIEGRVGARLPRPYTSQGAKS